MPLYEFECDICLEVWEAIRTSKQSYMACPKCGARIKRNFPTPSFRVTGFNSINGYALPEWNDLLDEHGYQKKGERSVIRTDRL